MEMWTVTKRGAANADSIDSQILAHVARDLQSPTFIKSLTESARKSGELTDDDAEGQEILGEIKKLDAKISKLSDLLPKQRQPSR